MIGLVKKDLFIVIRNLRSLLVIIVVFSLLTLNGDTDFSFFAVYMSIAIMMSTFSYDEYNKTDAFVSALPNGKVNSIKAKYVSTLIVVSVASIFSLLLTIVSGIINHNLDIIATLETVFMIWLSVLLVQAIFYPIIYKFGVEKGRIGVFALIFGIVIFGGVLSSFGFKLHIPSNVLNSLENILGFIIPVLIILIYVGSYFLVKKIYLKKEF